MHATSAIIVHGGAGSLGSDDPASYGGADAPRLEGVRRACEAGWAILLAGGSALDAVEAAVRILEDDPTFNAGTGATLTAAGDVELDASIMDGATLRCGAVAVVKDVRNPVSLARAIMERSHHVLLAGPGASAFAREVGILPHDNGLLVTPRQRARWEAARAAAGSFSPRGLHPLGEKSGTVGAAARDARGHLAAATSTGGMQLKLPGRVGDTPLIGCGTYADDALAAVSCTGHGERIIQLTLARHVAELVGRGVAATEAAREAVAALGSRVQGEGGVIVVGPRGEPGFANNTPVMSRAWTRADGTIVAEL
ncbi:isoaspartyl peptidase/L-asparaginase family protein [Anaeromyxobacter sp. Fw109-5]|uniref:isoaspartyl peptidase/L-asparaginase family protein n=1 Tax=Anaeromyxobacter sp. (strain Fw109-5) TaxID=404589 RepID=UPI0000ED7DD4|nr:isoaspartyl peptidase/L-asparaginase family protein [Anaeromyxobacter sp. Fw109-5]ABS25710.1 Asparaginase [Anaeromyxobacter sp. Fw109-5]